MDVIHNYEEVKKKNRHITIDAIQQNMIEKIQLMPVMMRYKDGRHYKSTYIPLLEREADYDRK